MKAFKLASVFLFSGALLVSCAGNDVGSQQAESSQQQNSQQVEVEESSRQKMVKKAARWPAKPEIWYFPSGS